MTTYVAITTTNSLQNGFSYICHGSNKNKVRNQARNTILVKNGQGIYNDTEQKNLMVISKTKAKRDYGIDIDNAEWMFYNE